MVPATYANPIADVPPVSDPDIVDFVEWLRQHGEDYVNDLDPDDDIDAIIANSEEFITEILFKILDELGICHSFYVTGPMNWISQFSIENKMSTRQLIVNIPAAGKDAETGEFGLGVYSLRLDYNTQLTCLPVIWDSQPPGLVDYEDDIEDPWEVVPWRSVGRLYRWP